MTDHIAPTAHVAETINLPLSGLILSDLNPRQEADAEGVAALAASIRAVGLMQNLSGFDRNGRIEIVAGGRRLRALTLLAETGDAPEFVPVRVTADPEIAMLWANTENSAREPLHPADEIRAYYRMLAEGQSTVAQVASAFAVTEAHVRRRARLGSLPDQVIDALKAGRITIGHAQAMTVAEDESLILDALGKIMGASYPGAYSEHEVRRMVSPQSVKASDRRLKFVGRAAYDAAGGKSTVDLFSDEVVLHSPDVLDRVFAEKLEEEADKALEAGWRWAETHAGTDLDYQLCATFARLYKEEGELTDAQAERYDELSELAQTEALDVAGQEELNTLDAILEGCFTEAQRAHSGLILYVNWHGELTSRMGFVHAEDIPAAIKAGVLAETTPVPRTTTPSQGEAAAKEKPALSQALLTDLQAMRSAAVQGAILDKPKLALDLLAFSLAERFGPLDMHYHASNITPSEGDGFAPDTRLTGIEGQDENDAEENPFAAFRAKGEKHRNAVLALIVARSLKYAATCYGEAGDRFPLFDEIEAEVKADIRQVWTPTAANFFARVSGAYLENLLADLTGCDRDSAEFRAFTTAKKKDKASTLERLFTDAEAQALWKIDTGMKARIDAWVPEGI